jgi:hypothetical protein
VPALVRRRAIPGLRIETSLPALTAAAARARRLAHLAQAHRARYSMPSDSGNQTARPTQDIRIAASTAANVSHAHRLTGPLWSCASGADTRLLEARPSAREACMARHGAACGVSQRVTVWTAPRSVQLNPARHRRLVRAAPSHLSHASRQPIRRIFFALSPRVSDSSVRSLQGPADDSGSDFDL